MKKIFCTFAVSATVAFSGQTFAKMEHFDSVQHKNVASLNIDGVNAYLQDITVSDNKKKPITCGLFRMEKGDALEYTYNYEESKIMLEGAMVLADASGKTVTLTPGDAVSFDKGDTITFSSDSYGLAFYCGQRAFGQL